MRFATKLHPGRLLGRVILPGALIISCTFSAQLSAQATAVAAPSVGSRVRVVGGSDASPVVGTLLVRRSDSLFVGREKDTIAVGRSDVMSIELSLGTRNSATAGMGRGLLAGASLGAIAGAAAYKPCHQTGFLACMMEPTSRGEAAGMGGIGGAVLGMIVGLIVGAETESWAPVGVESVTQFRVVPRAKGVVAQVSLSF